MSFVTIFAMALCFSHFIVVISPQIFLLAILPYSDVMVLLFPCDDSPPCCHLGHSHYFSYASPPVLIAFLLPFLWYYFHVDSLAVFTQCIQESKNYVMSVYM